MLLIFGPDRLLYRGPPVDGAPHRHHALQLAVSLAAPLHLTTQDGDQEAEGFVIDADTTHQLGGGAPELALLYLEAESRDGQRLSRALHKRVLAHAPPPSLRTALACVDVECATFDALCHDWLQAAGAADAAACEPMDSRIADTLAYLANHTDRPQSAAALAARVHLSADRLMHLFAASTGTSLRSYALWLRLKVALRTALSGATLTTAAHAAGFSDSAHLSHSFKAMFGLPPSFLFERRNELVVRFR